MRFPHWEDKRFLGRFRTSLMGLMEVPTMERLRKRGEKTGKDEISRFFDKTENSWGSRVIPIGKSIKPNIKIMPDEELLSLVEHALIAETTYCYCRTTFKNCDHPTDTCIGVSFGESYSAVRERKPRNKTNLVKIRRMIEECHDRGLVHQTIFYPSPEYFYVICNCCTCCCLSFRNLIRYGRENAIVTSTFIVEFTPSRCRECGKCVTRCQFGARAIEKDVIVFHPEKCWGCGLCVTTCSRNALQLVPRQIISPTEQELPV